MRAKAYFLTLGAALLAMQVQAGVPGFQSVGMNPDTCGVVYMINSGHTVISYSTDNGDDSFGCCDVAKIPYNEDPTPSCNTFGVACNAIPFVFCDRENFKIAAYLVESTPFGETIFNLEDTHTGITSFKEVTIDVQSSGKFGYEQKGDFLVIAKQYKDELPSTTTVSQDGLTLTAGSGRLPVLTFQAHTGHINFEVYAAGCGCVSKTVEVGGEVYRKGDDGKPTNSPPPPTCDTTGPSTAN